MAMKAAIYKNIPDCAREIRQKVFIEEQGFQEEFDEIDHTATHIVIFDQNETPVATCRVFWNAEMESYILGRLAVVKECRGKNIGSMAVREAERYVRETGGKSIALHAQCRASAFYQKMGYAEYGDIGDEEGCPHVWMRKSF